jgi:hypothetical protein
MSALEDFYNITLTLKRTNFDTQSQTVLFEIPAVMYPADPGQNLVLPLGPGGSEDFRIVTLYDIVTDGLSGADLDDRAIYKLHRAQSNR